MLDGKSEKHINTSLKLLSENSKLEVCLDLREFLKFMFCEFVKIHVPVCICCNICVCRSSIFETRNDYFLIFGGGEWLLFHR